MALFVVAARFLLGAVFAAAAVAKLRDSRTGGRFVAATLRSTGAPGRVLAGTLLPATVVVEAGTAGLLLLAPAGRAGVSAGFVASLALLAALSAVLALALRRDVRVPCGCFGPSIRPPARRDLVRNGGLAVLAALGLAGTVLADPAPLSAGAFAAAAGGLAAAVAAIHVDEFSSLFARDRREYP